MDQLFQNNMPYIVLARKYRPRSFDDLRGQDVLVRTICNAIKKNRMPHAVLLTGIRGVGKTTTARILAKTVNCSNLEEKDNILVPCTKCQNCLAFADEKHPDFIEIDAASKTGVSDIREIIDNCKYLPIMSKYKIYVIDEVHMLSINAFNALLKTLEEPPEHVIFVFATTEVRKVPITILSRCHRFDLRRLSQGEIVSHLKDVLTREHVVADQRSLEIIAKCSEGSVRDSLSILDQALSNVKDGKLISSDVESILGLGDKTQVIDLFESIVTGDHSKALAILEKLYFAGIDLMMLIHDILEIINIILLHKCSKDIVETNALYSQDDFNRIKNLVEPLSISYLTLLWQILIRSISELQISWNVYASVQVLLIKCCYVADKPMPVDLTGDHHIDKSPILKISKKSEKLTSDDESSAAPIAKDISLIAQQADNNENNNHNMQEEHIQYDSTIANDMGKAGNPSFREITDLFYQHKEMILYHHLYEDVHLVKIEPRVLKFRVKSNVPNNFANTVAKLLEEWTGHKWIVTTSSAEGEPTLKEIDDLKKMKENEEIVDNKIVKHALDMFENSKITSIVKKPQQ